MHLQTALVCVFPSPFSPEVRLVPFLGAFFAAATAVASQAILGT